jgi:hypothetical protein
MADWEGYDLLTNDSEEVVPQYSRKSDGVPKALQGDDEGPHYRVVDDDGNPVDFATLAKQDNILTALGLLSTAAKQDLAKTVLDNILSELQGTLDVQLTGSIEEYTWDSGDAEPDPGSGVRAFGVKHDSGDFTAYYWDGSSWGEI